MEKLQKNRAGQGLWVRSSSTSKYENLAEILGVQYWEEETAMAIKWQKSRRKCDMTADLWKYLKGIFLYFG